MDPFVDSDDEDDTGKAVVMTAVDGLLTGVVAGRLFTQDDALNVRKERAPKKSRKLNRAQNLLDGMYFDEESVYSEREFERRFQMAWEVFEKLCHGLTGRLILLRRKEATRKRT